MVVVLQVLGYYDIMFLKWAYQCRKISLRSPNSVCCPLISLGGGWGVTRGLCLQLAKLNIIPDFFPLKLGASNAVLGFQWLATLGDSVMSWGNLSLRVTLDGHKVTIQGDPTLSRAQVSPNSMARTLKPTMVVDGEEPTIITADPLPPTFIEILHVFYDIFEMSVGLPPPEPGSILLLCNSEPP